MLSSSSPLSIFLFPSFPTDSPSQHSLIYIHAPLSSSSSSSF
jgi:hypothetical protein